VTTSFWNTVPKLGFRIAVFFVCVCFVKAKCLGGGGVVTTSFLKHI
jgi:hypothetical protein